MVPHEFSTFQRIGLPSASRSTPAMVIACVGKLWLYWKRSPLSMSNLMPKHLLHVVEVERENALDEVGVLQHIAAEPHRFAGLELLDRRFLITSIGTFT